MTVQPPSASDDDKIPGVVGNNAGDSTSVSTEDRSIGETPNPTADQPTGKISVPRSKKADRATLLALAVVVLCAIISSSVSSRQPVYQEAGDKADKILTAYDLTKSACATAALPGLESKPALRLSPKTAGKYINSVSGSAIYSWYSIAAAKTGRPADWRRYGLCLAMFGRPGALEALLNATSFTIQKRLLEPTKSTITRRTQSQESSATIDEECAAWNAIFGPAPIAPARISPLRLTIARLNLGWFERVALARLDRGAGLNHEADTEVDGIRASANTALTVQSLDVILILVGIVALLFVGLARFLSAVDVSSRSRRSTPARSSQIPDADLTPPALPLSQAPAVGSEQKSNTPAQFAYSYRARTIAFVIYLGVFLLAGAGMRLLRGPMSTLSVYALLHIGLSLTILVYVPIVYTALSALRGLVAAESRPRGLQSWKVTLTNLGLRTRQPLADIWAGVGSYTMLFPIVILSAYASVDFFKYLGIKTPEHPLNYQLVFAQDRLSQVLLFVTAAVAAPIVEELMFRGLLYPALRSRYGVVAGAALSGTVFAIIHPTMPSAFLPLWIIGTWFALTFERRRSLLTTITMHALHNGISVVTMLAIMAR